VKTMSRPVIDRFDEFACQHLERVRFILLCFCLLSFPPSFKLILMRDLPSCFSSGATVLAHDGRQALMQMNAAQALNANENGAAAVASRALKYVT
jgi:hypothetical protein